MKKYLGYWLVSALALTGGSCLSASTENPANCTIPGNACGDEEVCDTMKQMCVPKKLSCTDSSACDFTVPACPALTHVCTACSADTECKSWSMTHNMFAGSAQAPKFNYCKTAACHECSPDAADTPEGSIHCPDALAKICDKTSLTCRGCVSDGDCKSGICRKVGDFPENAPVSGLMTGQCVAVSDIAYASNNASGCDNTMGTKTAPFCTVDKAIMSGKKYINLQGGNYPALSVTGGNVVIAGPGRDASTPAVFPSISLTGAGTLTLSGLQVSANLVAAAISCRGGSTLYVRDVAILKATGGRGIDAEQDCAKVFVDRTRINGTTNYGIIVGGAGSAATVQYSITNTAVTSSGVNVGVEEHGVYFGSKSSTTGLFAFNTVTNSCYRGVGCQVSRSISDSIVQGNQVSQVDACTQTRMVLSGAELEMGAEPKLKNPSTANDNCCVDKGLMPAGQIMVPTDFYGVSRPQGGGYDIGYHELK